MEKRPETREEWQQLSDAELVSAAQDYAAHISVVAQIEATRRLIAALKAFKRSSDRAALALVVLTLVLVVLTAAIVWLTAELD